MTHNPPQPTFLKNYVASPFLIKNVELNVDLHETFTLVRSHLQIERNRISPETPSDFILQGESLELLSVKMNGDVLQQDRYHTTVDALIIHHVADDFSLEITTRIKPHENKALNGLYQTSGNFCTQCEAEGFRHITYFLDRPDVMASFTTTITADEARYPVLLSNGNLIAAGKCDEGRHFARWQDPFKKPCYLFALVAGRLEYVEDFFVTASGRRVTLRIYVEKNHLSQCAYAMQSLKNAMRWDEENYGREYDLDIYMIVAVSDFNMGAMENKGLNIFNTQYILAKPETATDQDFIHVESVIAHEYFHNWTGNRVTCRDWFQLSLKEGLTIFRDQSFTEDQLSKTVARIDSVNDLRTRQFPEDAGPLAHPVQPESYIEINNFYTTTIYNKGAEVIRMMQTLLGKKAFRSGMDLYFERHDGQAVTIEEFVKAMEEASGVDLQQFRLWYKQVGTPVLTVSDRYDADKQEYRLTIQQSGSAQPLHIPIKMGLMDAAGKPIPLCLGEEKIELDKVLPLKERQAEFCFSRVPEKPIPSLLRGFSAPVKLNYSYSSADLENLFLHDADEFNRWEAGQKIAMQVLLDLIADHQQGKRLMIPSRFVEVFRDVLMGPMEDKLLLAEMLTLPSEPYIAEHLDVIDVDAVHVAREALLLELAKLLRDNWLRVYRSYINTDERGERRLKNVCLSYLMLLPDAAMWEDLGMLQFRRSLSHNMTDTLAILRSLVNINSPLAEIALAEFYNVFKNDALVLDKWFALQAKADRPDVLVRIKKLMQHEAFDLKNPNKVYALIGTLGYQNPVAFHAADGEGYQFLSTVVQELDQFNPQVAARMVLPLVEWRRYDNNRQKMMRQQLESILQNKKTSKDVYEIVSKSLKGTDAVIEQYC